MPSKTQSILLGGAIVGVLVALLSQIPVVGGCIACLGYAAAGVVGVWHYTNTNELTIASGNGAGMGALAGVVAALIASLIGYVLMTMGLIPDMQQVLEQMSESGQMPDEQLEMMEGIFNSPLFFGGMIVLSTILGAILGAIGGAIGASMFKKGGELSI